MTRRLLATGTRLQGQPPTLRTDMNTTDIYMPRSAYALPPLPGEHLEDAKTGLKWLDRAHEQARGYTPAHALPPLPGEHTEAVELDLATKSGAIVVLGGRVTVWEPSRTIFVDVTYSSTLSRSDASAALLGAVRDGRIGSDVVRAAVERGFTLRGYGEVEAS